MTDPIAPRKPSIVDRIDWREIGFIAGLGAFGGVIAAVLQSLEDGARISLGMFFIYPLLGAAAAILGIYLVFGTPREDARRFVALSIVSGMSFFFIFDASKAMIAQSSVKDNVAAIVQVREDIIELIEQPVDDNNIDTVIDRLNISVVDLEEAYMQSVTPREVGRTLEAKLKVEQLVSRLEPQYPDKKEALIKIKNRARNLAPMSMRVVH